MCGPYHWSDWTLAPAVFERIERVGQERRIRILASEVVQVSQCLPPLRATDAGHSSMILKIRAFALSAVPDEDTGVNQ